MANQSLAPRGGPGGETQMRSNPNQAMSKDSNTILQQLYDLVNPPMAMGPSTVISPVGLPGFENSKSPREMFPQAFANPSNTAHLMQMFPEAFRGGPGGETQMRPQEQAPASQPQVQPQSQPASPPAAGPSLLLSQAANQESQRQALFEKMMASALQPGQMTNPQQQWELQQAAGADFFGGRAPLNPALQSNFNREHMMTPQQGLQAQVAESQLPPAMNPLQAALAALSGESQLGLAGGQMERQGLENQLMETTLPFQQRSAELNAQYAPQMAQANLKATQARPLEAVGQLLILARSLGLDENQMRSILGLLPQDMPGVKEMNPQEPQRKRMMAPPTGPSPETQRTQERAQARDKTISGLMNKPGFSL